MLFVARLKERALSLEHEIMKATGMKKVRAMFGGIADGLQV